MALLNHELAFNMVPRLMLSDHHQMANYLIDQKEPQN